MDETVELLLKRMESNPEEFCDSWDPEADNSVFSSEYRMPKWRHVIYQLRQRMGESPMDKALTKPLPFLSDEQVNRLYDKYVEIQGKEFEKYVLRTLLHGEHTVRYGTDAAMRISAGGSIGIASTAPRTSLTANTLPASALKATF